MCVYVMMMHNNNNNSINKSGPQQQQHQKKRAQDLAESHHLLLELLASEPFMQECLQMIENICLSREIDFTVGTNSSAPSTEFKAFVNRYYPRFLKNAIRQAHGLGFVVWCVRRLPSGDKVPEVLPLGTFTWSVEMDPTNRGTLRYRIQLVVKDVPFHVTEWVQPSFNVTEGSILHATVQTPLAHLIEEYRILRDTVRRYHHADAWNTTARIVVSSEPKQFNHESSQKEVFDALDFLKGAMETRKKQTLTPVEEAFANQRSSNHNEMVYELPPHHHIEPMPVLKPVVDMDFITNKFRHSVCSLLGIPPGMMMMAVGGGHNGSSSSSSNQSRGKATSQIFQNKMSRMCMFLSDLMQEVHEHIYNKEQSRFYLAALPRLEIQGIEDLKTLHEIGVLQPDHAMQLSEVLLCPGPESKRRKLQQVQQQQQKQPQKQQQQPGAGTGTSTTTTTADGNDDNNNKNDTTKNKKKNKTTTTTTTFTEKK